VVESMNSERAQPAAPIQHRETAASAPRRLTPAMILMMIWTTLVFPSWFVGPFVVAGTVAWGTCWIYFAVLLVGLTAHRRTVARRNPELLRRRQNIGEGSKRWDIAWNLLFWPQMAATPIVAGFDVRHGAALMPIYLWPVGLLCLASGFALSAWAMAENPHFEGTVRIQKDRDHRVIDRGPYRKVRHPGYVGLVLWALATPLLLRSWLACIPAVVVTVWLVLRTALEDSTLRRELAGYEAYQRRVRFRLVPGLW
jgi:protein-S-isoprenylcysteine O-methyltransferase Ste14